MRNVYLEQRGSSGDVEHNKYYRITDNGTCVIAEWGAIGASGQKQVVIESDDAQAREAAFDSKLKAKAKKGYVVIRQDGEQVEARPDTEGRRWGLEIETHSSVAVGDVVKRMKERGLVVNVRTNSYFQSNGRQWDVKADGSCGYEFASPILSGDAGMFDAKLAVEKIREVCPTATNSKCGLHVTVDIADHSPADIKRLIIGYLRAQDFFYAECNESRQSNTYCQKNPTRVLVDCINAETHRVIQLASPHSRYHGLNVTTINSRKVVEFRMMESTVAIRKVGAWIRMCVGFVDGLKKSGITFKSTTPFVRETFDTILACNFTK